MLHEAPTIQKAIEQAWHDAGKPAEFTIKILDSGEKGLLWFSKRPAIISITFDPKKTNNLTTSTPSHHNKQPQQKKLFKEKKNPQKQDKKEITLNNKTSRTSSIPAEKITPTQVKEKNTHNASQSYNETENVTVSNIWTSETVNYVSSCLKELTSILNITSSFTTQPNEKVLHVIFDKKLYAATDEEKILFISFSYLLMQFLKKKFKKKFKGFQLIINSKESHSNGSKHTKQSSRASQQ